MNYPISGRPILNAIYGVLLRLELPVRKVSVKNLVMSQDSVVLLGITATL
jgi:hypothetical protein